MKTSPAAGVERADKGARVGGAFREDNDVDPM